MTHPYYTSLDDKTLLSQREFVGRMLDQAEAEDDEVCVRGFTLTRDLLDAEILRRAGSTVEREDAP